MRLMTSDYSDHSATENEPLWTADDVAKYLKLPRKKVYELPITRVQLSSRRVRFLRSDVMAYTKRQRG